jgi:hypothetical protein
MGKPRLALFVMALSLLTSLAAEAEDGAAIKSLLKQYSPDAYYVVDAYSKRSAEYEYKDFMAFWDGSSDDATWRSYGAIVRESAFVAMKLLSENDSTLIVVSKDKSYQVPWTSVFYTRVMADDIPERLRLTHYGVVNDKRETITQAQAGGVYSMLQEMSAYYLAAKASWELLPYIQGQGAKAPWASFFKAVDESLEGMLEFKYYTLKYLVYLQRDSPQYYREVMANKLFAKAFLGLDSACTGFLKRLFAASESLYESIGASSLPAKEEGVAAYSALASELAKPIYRELVAKLSGGTPVENTPPFPGTELEAKGAAPPIVAVISEAEALKLGGLNIGYGRRSAVIATQQLRAARMSPKKAAPATATKPSAPATTATPAPRNPEADSSEAAPEESSGQAEETPALSAGAKAAIADILARRPSGAARLSLSAKDELGDVEVKAVDIAGADIRLFPERLVCGISFAAFDGKLPLNSKKLEDNAMEYDCSVVIDMDGRGKNVYTLSLTWFKEPNSQPIDARLLEVCSPGLWKTSSSGASIVETEVTATSSGSFLFLVLEDSAAFPLKRLTEKTRFSVTTYYDQGSGPMEDSLEL